MSAQIINFPSNRVLPAIIPFFDFSPEIETITIKEKSSAFQTDTDYSDKEYEEFDEIIADKELAKEMFPPDYFMLVE